MREERVAVRALEDRRQPQQPLHIGFLELAVVLVAIEVDREQRSRQWRIEKTQTAGELPPHEDLVTPARVGNVRHVVQQRRHRGVRRGFPDPARRQARELVGLPESALVEREALCRDVLVAPRRMPFHLGRHAVHVFDERDVFDRHHVVHEVEHLERRRASVARVQQTCDRGGIEHVPCRRVVEQPG
ncbi:hypothetical protein D3C71_1155200 [compost metagenome]